MFNPNFVTDPHLPVSPLSIKAALNWNPRVAAHIEPWFNTSTSQHLNIGYTSNDPIVVASQVAFLRERGVDFVIFDWYGKDDRFIDSSCLAWKVECERQGMDFAICFDYGIVKFHLPAGTSPTDYMKAQLQYVLTAYGSSPNYEKTSTGKLLAIEFGWEGAANFDAKAVLAAFPQFAMLWENAGGYSQPGSAGAYAWVGLNNIEAYQADFLAQAAKHPSAITMGSLCKGFDDHNRRPNGDPKLSCWGGPARFTDEKNGQTFLNVIDIYNKSTFKPPYLQLVTFNDHEEGTNLEWGINSMLAASVSESGGIVTVTLNGNINTVARVELYVDGTYTASFSDLTQPLTYNLNAKTLAVGPHTVHALVKEKAFFQEVASNILTIGLKYAWS